MTAVTMTRKKTTNTAVTVAMAYSDTCRKGASGALMSSSEPMTKDAAPPAPRMPCEVRNGSRPNSSSPKAIRANPAKFSGRVPSA